MGRAMPDDEESAALERAYELLRSHGFLIDISATTFYGDPSMDIHVEYQGRVIVPLATRSVFDSTDYGE